jgi:methyl-accepting chemotaxis protein
MESGMTIKKRLILTFIGLFLASVAVMGFFSHRNQQSQLRESLKEMARTENSLFGSILAADAEGLARAHAGLTRLDSLLAPFAARNREALLAAAAPLFAELKKSNNITHMYFIDPDGTVFLRVHKPEQSGDLLKRATYKAAAQTGAVASGLEMGKNFFSLRSVHPVSYQGVFLGYLEIAEEIDHVFAQMKGINGDDVAVFLADDYLGKIGAEVKNEKAGAFTLLDATDRKAALGLAGLAGEGLQQGLAGFEVRIVDLAGRKYAVASGPLKDAFGATAGVIFSHREITPLFAAMWQGVLTSLLLFAAILLGAALLLFLSLRPSLALFQAVKGHILNVTTHWDLTRRLEVERRDEIGELGNDFNLMTGKLAEIVAGVNALSSELGRVAADIRRVSGEVLGSAETQAQNVASTVSAVAEIDASVREVAESVDSLAASAGQTSSSIAEMAASIEESAINTDKLSGSVEEVTSSIAEMAVSVRQVGENVQQLMQAAGTAASSVSQMDATTRQVEKNAADAAAIAVRVLQDAERGKLAVDATIDGMQSIRRSSQVTADVVTNLSGRMENIGAILSIIDEIAEQTNLLALNASILAAQAGEHGRGFAVVAEEIKELAERTRTSTREIGTVISGIQEESRRAVEAIGAAEGKIEAGERLSQQSGEALAEIVAGVRHSTVQVEEIARAMREQAAGGQMIRSATERVAEMVNQIVQANREQERAGTLIMKAAERMRGLTGQVRTSARDQSTAGRQISRATENVVERIERIKRASDEQRKGSGQIMQAVENIRLSTESSLEAVKILDGTLGRLSAQVGTLNEELGRFKVAG